MGRIIQIYSDAFIMLWLKLGYLLYLVDRLGEKLCGKLIDRDLWELAFFIRTYGTRDSGIWMHAGAMSVIITEELGERDNETLTRCYFGLQLIARICAIHLGNVAGWLLRPAFDRVRLPRDEGAGRRSNSRQRQ
jgi:hypothetical protein